MPIALVGLAPVVTALMALLALLAGGILVELIGRAIDASLRLPGVQFIGAWVQIGLNSALAAMAGMLESVVQGISSFFTAAPHAFAAVLQAIEAFAWQHWLWIHNILTIDIPNLWSTIWSQVGALYQYISNSVDWLYKTLRDYIGFIKDYILGVIYAVESAILAYVAQLAAALNAAIANALAAALSYSVGLFNTAMGYIGQVYSAVTALIVSQIMAAEQYAEKLANWAIQSAVAIATQYAKAYADALVALLMSGLNVACAAALAPVWPQVFDDIEAIARAIPGSIADILIRLGRIPRVIPADLIGALSILLAVGAIAIDWVMKCGVKLCANLDGFADEVSGLSDEILTAGMIAFAVEAIANPGPTAQATDDYIIEPVITAGKDFASMVGVSL